MDILINVSKLTEGFDDPKIQTVFLTRPTQSEILFSQMIGRGLRGGIKGTKDVYLVSFEDHWEQFQGWLDTQKMISLFELENEIEEKEKIQKDKKIFQKISFDVIDELYSQIQTLDLPSVPSFECWPLGWYSLNFDSDSENAEVELPISRTIIVFSHQKQSWDELSKYISSKKPMQKECEQFYLKWFYDLPNPGISQSLMNLFIDACYSTGEYIAQEFFTLENREEASVDKLAKILYDESVGGRLRKERIEKWYAEFPILSDIYITTENFSKAVANSIHKIEYPHNDQKIFARGEQYLKVEKLKISIPETDNNKLISVFEELKANKLLFPNGYDYSPTIEWTQRVMKSYFGIAYVNSNPLKIKINRILNSGDIEENEEMIKFIMYHEMLHFSVSKYHNDEFKKYERKYPDVDNLNGLLDSIGMKYDIDSKYK